MCNPSSPPCHLQFNLGHLEQLDKARKALDAAGLQGVHLGGNYVSGERVGSSSSRKRGGEGRGGYKEEVEQEVVLRRKARRCCILID